MAAPSPVEEWPGTEEAWPGTEVEKAEPPPASAAPESSGLSAGISGSTPVPPPPETPTMSPDDPRYPEAAQAVDTGLQTAQAFARPFQADFSGEVPADERLRQFQAARAERKAAVDEFHALSSVDLDSVEKRIEGAQNISKLLKKERDLKAINQGIFAQNEERKSQILRDQLRKTSGTPPGSPEPNLAATAYAGIAGGVTDMAASIQSLYGNEEVAKIHREVAEELHQDAAIKKGPAAEVVRGLSGVLPLIAGLPSGKAGAVQGIVRAALGSYSQEYQATGDHGKAMQSALLQAPVMGAFILGGAAAGKGVQMLLPKNTSALVAGLANFAGAEVSNVGVSNVMQALHGEEYGLSNFSADTLFALFHGWGGYKGKVDAATRERVANELRSRGWSQEQLDAPYQGGKETPATMLFKAPEEAQPFPREGLMDKAAMDAEVQKQGGEPTPAAPAEAPGNTAPDYDPDGIGLRSFIQKRVSEGKTREEALAEYQSATQGANDWVDNLPAGTKIQDKEGHVYTKESDGTLRAEDGSVRSGSPLGAKIIQEAPAPPAELSVHDVVPSIRVKGETVKGQKGDPAHTAIYDRYAAEKGDPDLSVFENFDHPKNPNFFSVPKSAEFPDGEMSRAQLRAKFNVSDAQGLKRLQDETPEPQRAAPAAETPEPVKAYVEAPNISAAESQRRAAVAKEVESPLFKSEPLPEPVAASKLRPIETGETGGLFSRSKAPPKVKAIGAPPSGNPRWLKVEPWYKRAGFEREGASSVLRTRQENPIGKALGRATDKQFDVQDELQGKMWKKMDDATRSLSSKQQEAAFDELANYTREKENGRPTPALGPAAQKVLTAWQDIAEFTGMLAQAKGVKVGDVGGYRPMRLIGREYVPRMFDPEFMRVIRDPNANPAAFNKYVADLAAKQGITPDVAAKELNDMAGGKGRLASNDFMGNIELARGEKLPESFYDYDMRRVISRYVDGYSRRMGQIIAYGQRLEGPAGPVQKNLWDVARDEVQGGDQLTRDWLNEAEAQSTGEQQVGGFPKMGQRLQTLATGLLLANPTSTVPRNLLSGLETAAELIGTRRTIRAAARAMTSAGDRLSARETGAVKDDMAALLHADQLQGDGKVDAGIRWLTSTMLKASGYDLSERFVRTTNFLAGSQFARDAAAALKSSPNGRKARQMAGLIERMGVKPDDIVSEGGDWKTGEQTRRFIRAVIGQTQGGYRFNQVPLWAGTKTGRFFYQFGRWGTQRAQNLWNNVFKPAFVGTESNVNGVKMSVRDFKPMVRMGLGTVALGESFALLAQTLFGKDRRDASLTEIAEAFSKDKVLGIKKALSRAINDVIMSGSLGIWGQPVDLARAAKDQSRLKNPAEPPGGAGMRAAVELVQNAVDQGTLTGDDVKRFAQSFVPGVSATMDVARNALDQPKYEAENDQRTLRMAGLRFADDKKLDVNAGGGDQGRKTENTPLFSGIRDALLVGDVAKAKQLKAQYLRQFSGGKKREDAMRGLQNSVIGRQPFRVGPFTNDKVKEDFHKWAKRNLSKEDLTQVIRVQARYERAAKAAKLWKGED